MVSYLREGLMVTADMREEATGDGVGVTVSCLTVDVLAGAYLPVRSPRGSVQQEHRSQVSMTES